MNKTDFDNKLISFNEQITSNKTKHLEVKKKLNSLITKVIIFLHRIYFTGNDGSQDTFIYQPTLDTLEFKKGKVRTVFLVGNQREYIILKLSHYILLSYITKLSGYNIGIKIDKDP